MSQSDIFAIIQWWAIILFLGIGFMPFISLVFSRFFDRGYFFAKIFGIAIVSYGIFFLSLVHILPFSTIATYLVAFGLMIIFFSGIANKKKVLHMLWIKKWLFLFEEGIFLVALLFWSQIRSYQPDIHGLEKFMDYGFLNSILRTSYFPPKDMWFTPFSINYYYFGHLVTGVLTKLSTLPANITFNLMIATIFASCFTLAFSIGANLYALFHTNPRVSFIKRLIAGLLSALLVSLAGNLHIIYAFFKPYATDHPAPFWALPFMPFSFPNEYWYPNATRFIFHTIHEFPIYSWVVSDLHGHVLDIPFVLFVVGLLLAIFAKSEEQHAASDNKPRQYLPHFLNKMLISISELCVIAPKYVVLFGFFIAVLYMTNAWDGAIYLLLSSCIFFVIGWEKRSFLQQTTAHQPQRTEFFLPLWLTHLIRNVVATILFTFFLFLFFSLPYNLAFKPFAYGIGIMCAPDFLTKIGHIGPFLFEPNHCEHSYWWELLTLYGFFYFYVLSLVITLFIVKKGSRIDKYILVLMFFSLFLILLPELIYVKDIYPTYFRANTMFKLVFQAFIILSLTSGYTIVRILTGMKGKILSFRFLVFLPVTVVFLILVFIYPYFAINSYYGNLKTPHGLNGTAYLQTLYPTDYAAIQWLNTTIQGQPVIVEAQGDSYTDFARVSSNTGLPTVLGWTVHEWLWRGSYDVPAPRITEVQTIYQSPNTAETKRLLKKYDVSYVFIGAMEYQKYPGLNEKKFAELGKIVYQNGSTKIYQISSK